jgi:NDP-sugar pyrophosphorylase family protein
MQAVILAGGEGTRMKECVGALPKALVNIHGKPLLEHIFTLLQHQGFRNVILCTGFGGDAIRQWAGNGERFNLRLQYSHETVPLGTAGAVRNILPPLDDPFLVLYGDVLVGMDLKRLVRYHKQKNGFGTLVLHPSTHPHDSDLVRINEESRITAFCGKPNPGEPFVNLTNAALYVMRLSCLNYVAEGKESDFVKDVFPEMLNQGEPLYGYVTDEYLKDVGTPERLKEAERDFSIGLVPIPSRGS